MRRIGFGMITLLVMMPALWADDPPPQQSKEGQKQATPAEHNEATVDAPGGEAGGDPYDRPRGGSVRDRFAA